MLQFTADSDRGRLLGLGLSLGNLELLEAGEPAFVSLDDHQSSGTLLIACAEDHEGVARARRELDAASEPVIELLFDAEARETLRRGTPIVRPLAAPDLDTAICFSGADELEMLTGLRGHPLFADVQVAGLDEYWLHEQGACPGCPRCAERAATADFFYAAASDPAAAVGVRRRSLWRRWFERSNLAVGLCVGLILLVALAVTAVVELREHYEDKAREARERALADRAAVQIASDQRRRARLAAGAAETLTPRPGAAPCPHQIRAPALLGRRVLPGALPRAEGRSAFEAAAGLVVVKQQLDLMPARREGVGPVARRLHADAYVDRRARPFEVLFQQTFVVTRWQDPGILRDTEAHLRTASGRSTKVVRTLLGEERITELGRRSFRTGIVAGRLLVWDLERRRFACVSPEVEVVTPRLTLVRHSGAATKHVVIDDVLNKARLETLLAAIRAATRELRQIAQ